MFFVKFFYFLKGYVIIRVETLCVERFISICIRREIRLLEIGRRRKYGFLCVVSNEDFRRMIPVVYKTKAKISVVKKYSFKNFRKRLRSKIGFFTGAAVFPLIIFVMSQFVWSVQINGANMAETEELRRSLKEWGISTGVPTVNLPDASYIKFKILSRFENISWAWIYTEGARVRVEVRKGILPPMIEDVSVPCDIIAAKSGIITDIVTKRGVGCVEKGNAVGVGDVLIAGTVENKNGGFSLVHSEGQIFANTSETISDVFPLFREISVPTGETKRRLSLKLFSCVLPLFNENELPFEHFVLETGEWSAKLGSDFYLGVAIRREIFKETDVLRIAVPYETAVESAQFELEKRISEKILPESVLNESRIYAEKRDEETVYVSLTMNFTEKIGTQRLLETKGEKTKQYDK